MPGGKTRRNDWTIAAGGKLLQTGKQRLAADEARHRLNEAGAWVGLHRCLQPHEGSSRHHAVGIENDKIGIGGAEPLYPVADVARLLAEVGRAPAEKDRDRRLRSQASIEALFEGALLGALCVAQDEDVKAIGGAAGRKVAADGFDRSGNGGSVLAVDGKQQRRASAGVPRRSRERQRIG